MAENLTFRARGWSMAPAILPGSALTVERVDATELNTGDVMCYPVDSKTVVAHRVVEVKIVDRERVFTTRGDAQSTREEVPSSAAVFRVSRVRLGHLGYDTDGPVGRACAALALRNESLWRGGGRLVGSASKRLLRSRLGTHLRRPLKSIVRVTALEGDDLSSFLTEGSGRSASDPLVAKLVEEHARGERIQIVALLARKAVGRAAVARMWRPVGIDELFVCGVWVHPGLRGLGIGNEIVQVALEEATTRFEDDRIHANTAFDNEPAKRLFEKAGFTRVRDRAMSELIESALAESMGTSRQQLLFCYRRS